MASPRRRLTTIGAGYVGLVTGVGLASLGHTVEIVELRADRLEELRAGRIPLHEAGLQDAFREALDAGRITISDRRTTATDLVLVCVGTPIGQDGRSDLSQLRSALADLADLPLDVPIVIRSTVPPGGTRAVVGSSGLARERVLTNPEFLRQGTALHDFLHPTRLVIGRFQETQEEAVAVVAGLFDGLDAPRLIVGVEESELIKNGSNAFLALKLSFTNEMASLSEEYGANIDDVLAGLSLDPRIGSSYMRPSFGFGGSCLPKELKALAAAGAARGLPMYVTTAGSSANAATQERFVERISRALGGLPNRTIGLLGLAFKAGTDDTRDSPALYVARRLLEEGASVVAYDPEAAARAQSELPGLRLASSAQRVADGADAIVIATEWPEFRELDWAAMVDTMATPMVIDGRRLLDAATMSALGFRYVAVGSPMDEPAGAMDQAPLPV